MAGRWQLSLCVLAGLVLTVVALWESATVSAVADRVTERTETVDGSAGLDGDDPAPSDLVFGELDGSGPAGGGSNLLRPTTTTTTRPTTTATATSAPVDPPTSEGSGAGGPGTGGEQAPGSATTVPVGDEGDGPGSTNPNGSSAPRQSSTMVGGDPAMATVFQTDFANGSLVEGRWSIANSVGHDGWGLLRPSSVAVVSDPSAAGGHVLAVTAHMGAGAESGQVVSGALRLLDHGVTHGRYTIRARLDPDPDGATAGVVVLVPSASDDASETDGGEIRIMETGRNRSTRTPVESNLRWNDSGVTASIEKAHRTAAGPVSASAWHVYTLDWATDRVVVSLDGEPLTLTVDPTRVPQGPMDLAIRLDPLDTPSAPGEQPTLSGEVRLLIDWIRIEQVGVDSPQ